MNVDFVVTTAPFIAARRPVIGVDGPVQGADLCFDHHATGEPVNLLALPESVRMPGTIATAMLDSDAVISAAVVLLRALEERDAVGAVWAPLYEAAHYCDHLIASGLHPTAERAGLGLHCWLKDKGLALAEVLAWGAGELRSNRKGGLQPVPSLGTLSRVFKELTLALVAGIRRGILPSDFAYLERLAQMEAEARCAVRRVEGRVTVLAPEGYLDPLAFYRVVETDLVVISGQLPNGAFRYTLGVHPRAYARLDLRPIFAALNVGEPGWGGGPNRGGSPLEGGSRIPLDELLAILNGGAL